jgi:hypothetical protein
MTVINTPAGMRLFRLAQLRGAVRLEKVGLKHSSGRSVRKMAALELGMKQNAKADAVLAKLQDEIDKIQAERQL